MSIINRYSLVEATGLNNETIREDYDRNPVPSYRELLAAEPTPEQAAAGVDFFPYTVPFLGKGVMIVSIPHGLTTDPNNPIIPDVVIPLPVYVIGEEPDPGFVGDVRILVDGTGLTTTSGWTADADNVYLAVQGGLDQEVLFFVYIEWTHSVIRNEIVTGAYEYIASFGF